MVTPEPQANRAVEPIEVAGWPASIPKRLATADIARIEATTRDIRAVDYQYGGGACHDAVVAFLSWSRRLLGIEAADAVTGRLHVALADLHNLAGWTAFDTHRLNTAGTHLDQALTLARTARNDDLVANMPPSQDQVTHESNNLPPKTPGHTSSGNRYLLYEDAASTNPRTHPGQFQVHTHQLDRLLL